MTASRQKLTPVPSVHRSQPVARSSGNRAKLSFDEFDELHSPRNEPSDFEKVSARYLSRRGFLHSSAAVGAAAFVASSGPFALRGRGESLAAAGHSWLPFSPVAANSKDDITIPGGFSWYEVMRWGDPLWSGVPEFDHATSGTGESQEGSFGDNCDGMSFFSRGGTHLLAVNNEYTTLEISNGHRASGQPETPDDVRKAMAAHGVSVVELQQLGRRWQPVRDSFYNRRITLNTPMELTGPARGHALMRTAADPQGVRSFGTWNNCGNGRTPWGTYLTCEENFNGYFSSSNPDLELTPQQKRYGINIEDWGYSFSRLDERFDVSKHPNEPHRAGWVVEIDPFNPSSAPKKRTALGRIKHENAAFALASDGRAVVYMGDDERGEFLYRFVSDVSYKPGGDNSSVLETGELSVAKFNDDGTGRWIPLTPETTGIADDAAIRIFARQAASAVGATTMDRPEWVTVNPVKDEVCCALTNNKNRGVKPNAGGDDTSVNAPNPREKNNYGQIVRWRPAGGDHASEDFTWDLFVMAGNPFVHDGPYAGSENVTRENTFNSPDGLAFDTQGGLWIQTDGNYSNEGDFQGQGNNQMLFGDTTSGEIHRFLVGPNGCEVTGITWSADLRTMFVGIQHPGEAGNSSWPDGPGSVPRSTVIAIVRDDGGSMG